MAEVPAPLRALTKRPERAALFLDYDGTLAPIVDDPTAARPLPGVRQVLDRLAARLGLVAVVSGRPVSFLLDVLGQQPTVHLAGLYGMEERLAGGQVRGAEGVEAWRPVVAAVSARLLAEAPPGIEVEEKGLTVTLHWRANPAEAGWAERVGARAFADEGLVAQPGRLALELRPPLAIDKGTVIRRLASGHEAVGCFGDDLGDLPAFAALGDLARAGVAVARVAVVDADSPPEVAAAADLVVAGPTGALELLRLLAGDP